MVISLLVGERLIIVIILDKLVFKDVEILLLLENHAIIIIYMFIMMLILQLLMEY